MTKPILFSSVRVSSILEGRKTQTRRVVKGVALDWLAPGMFTPEYVALPDNGLSPYGFAGHQLWVRETWSPVPTSAFSNVVYDPENPGMGAVHRAGWSKADPGTGWKPSIHMPRWASRITLEVTGVRVERVQDIGDGDCISEGVRDRFDGTTFFPARHEYKQLWDSINAKRGYPWSSNPWVWVVSFRLDAPQQPLAA